MRVGIGLNSKCRSTPQELLWIYLLYCAFLVVLSNMDENVQPEKNLGSPVKHQGSFGKNTSLHLPAIGQRSPLKDIANCPSEGRTFEKDIKGACQQHEDEAWHMGTGVFTHINHTSQQKFEEVNEDSRISREMRPELAVDIPLHKDVEKFREVSGVSLGDSESEYESAEELEENEKTFIQKVTSGTPVINSTVLSVTCSANCTPDRSDNVFENSLLNSFENMKIAETDEPALEEDFHDANDVIGDIVRFSPHSRKVHEENISMATKINDQSTASSKDDSEILSERNKCTCSVLCDKDCSHCAQSVIVGLACEKPIKEPGEKKEAMVCTGKEETDELKENVSPLNELDNTCFDPFTEKTNFVISSNKKDAIFITESETSSEIIVPLVINEAKETVLQKEGTEPEKKDKIMEKGDSLLENNDAVVESKNSFAKGNGSIVESEVDVLKKDTNSEKEDTASEREDSALEKEVTASGKDDPSQEEKTSLEMEDTSLERETSVKGEKTFLEKEEDPKLNVTSAKSSVSHSFDKQDKSYTTHSTFEGEIWEDPSLMIPKSNDSKGNSLGKELLKEMRKDSFPQQGIDDFGYILNNPLSYCFTTESDVNLQDKVDDIYISESVIESPDDKSFKSMISLTTVIDERTHCQKPEINIMPKKEISPVSSENERHEETLEHNVPHQKVCQMALLEKKDDPDFNPLSTKSSIVNFPDKENFKSITKEEPQCQTPKRDEVLKKKEMSPLSSKKKSVCVPMEYEIPHLQKGDQMDFVDKLNVADFSDCTTFAVVNPLDRRDCIKQEMGIVHEKIETSLSLEEVPELKEDNSFQKSCKINFPSKLDDPKFDPFSARSFVNSPIKKDCALTNEEGMPNNSLEMEVILAGRETPSLSDGEVTEIAGKEIFSLKGCQIDFQDKLDDQYTTKSSATNSPEKKEFLFVNEKETQSQKPKLIVTPEKRVNLEFDSKKREDSSLKEMSTESVIDDSPPKNYSHMDFLSKLDDSNFDPFKTKASVQNSPVRKENAVNTQVESNEKTIHDDPMSDVIPGKKSVKKSKKVRKPVEERPVSQENSGIDPNFDTFSTKAATENCTNKKEPSDVDKKKEQSRKPKTVLKPKKKHEKQVMCKEKETLPLQKGVMDTAVKRLPSQKCHQNDCLSKLGDQNCDPFATKSFVGNSPEKKNSFVNEEETWSQKPKTGVLPSNKQDMKEICKEKETRVSSQREVEEPVLKDSAPLDRCYQMSNFDDHIFDPFKTKATVQNSPIKKENTFNIHMETEEKTNYDNSELKVMPEDMCARKAEKMVTESIQSNTPEFQETIKRDCLKKVDQKVILRSNEIKSISSAVSPSKCELEVKTLASTRSDENDVFSPVPKSRARKQDNLGAFNSEEEFTSATDFFSNPEDLDVLGTHGTEGDKLNLVRNSLYVKFDPLVSGRQSLAPYLAQELKESELDPRRCSGLISFSPSPVKRQKVFDTTGTPVRALLSTREDETILLDATDLDNTAVTDGGNITLVSSSQTLNNTVICSSAADSANETIIHQPVVSGEKMVTEREMNEKLKNMELIMQDNELRKCREYEEVQKSLKQQIMEDGIALTALEDENSALKSSIQQMQNTLTKILHHDAAKKKEHKNQLQLLENQYELKCVALRKECQQYQDELKKSEVPFFDLVKKYERLREVLECLRRNEESLKADNERLKTKIAEKEENFKTVIQTYEDKLGTTEQEVSTLKQTHAQELKKASVMLKKAEVKILSLTETVEKLNTEKERITDLLEDITKHMDTSAM
ncbi:uncharacterized protein [Panulirus ornatus]|uniref:uncharacterized protein isoform X2 n=1 Tax=Panulirus ornatus TaxID=150431 RepID=UPI003A86014C